MLRIALRCYPLRSFLKMMKDSFNSSKLPMKTHLLPPPQQMTPAARVAEITAILAAAVVRTHLSQIEHTEREQRDKTLGFLPGQSVHTNPYQPESL